MIKIRQRLGFRRAPRQPFEYNGNIYEAVQSCDDSCEGCWFYRNDEDKELCLCNSQELLRVFGRCCGLGKPPVTFEQVSGGVAFRYAHGDEEKVPTFTLDSRPGIVRGWR